MEEFKENARKRFIPIVRDKTAEKLKEECMRLNPNRILEIGTAIGYSAILMLKSCSGTIYTIEKNQERFNEAEENFKKYGIVDRVKLVLNDALIELEKLTKIGDKFDFIFLDGPKGQYIKYLPLLKELLTEGGELFADNVKVCGLLEDEEKVTHKNRTMVRNMKKFIDCILNDKELDSKIFDVEDGFSISIKR